MDAMFSNMTLQNDPSLSNGTEIDPGPIQISWQDYVPPIIFGFIFLVGVAGNFLVIYVVALFKKMRTVTTYYLVNLAVTDLAFLLCCVPFTAVNYVTTSYVFGQAMCKFVNYLMQVTVQATCLTLALLSLDRYIAILHPMLSLTFRRKRVAIIGSIIIWIASFIMPLPTALYYRLVTITWYGESLKICRPVYPSKAWERGYQIFSILFLYFLPLAVCLFTCSAIVYRLYNRFQSDTNQMDTQRKKRTRRTACMVIGVVAVFAVCWLPNHVINLWAMLTEVKEITNALHWIKVTALILTYTNSATNPFIYAMARDDFRTCVKSAFCAAKEKKQPGLAPRSKTPKTTSSSSGRPLVVPAKLRKSPVLVCVEAQTVRPHIETETTV
ncbi:PREDICTED: G-protein coupled receptor 54-like [Branchiostoma belcheri]|uniref:G-protein coupled receptor 54-like n=1 Tax=Branchiostoma belcheri TaxID=7741 RepID=A0A6P4YIW6_BRABE|nr:PREDICTED: G-protein coupled receptor 54-like [Branchiostoma belcheri]